MTNGQLKTTVAWYIIGSQVFLLALVFILELGFNKLTAMERSAAVSATLPPAVSYISAAIAFMLTHQEASRSAWARRRISPHTAVISISLPLIPFLAAVSLIVLSALGRITDAQFSEWITYVQTAQAFLAASIFGHWFAKEMRSIEKPNAAAPQAGQ